ncbi:unnamed protein product [Caenorhabditis sp. 36 PRJEB53466]|nr:unnamed protein product [Caenorhabditis sp. 36 PRJEB53466]
MDEGPSSSSNGSASKCIVPEEEAERVGGPQLRLNVDPDFVDELDQEDGPAEVGADAVFVENAEQIGGVAPEHQENAAEGGGGVKMSIGNEEDEEETEEDRKRRFAEGIRRIGQNKQQESFDLDEAKTVNLRQFINGQMFTEDNQIDFDPVIKRKDVKVVEGYIWGAQIGMGSYGKVKECIDASTLTRRAVKIMKYEKLRRITHGWDNIRTEMAILRRLSHKNVIKMIEVFNIPSRGKVYMIFEYCIGSVQQLLDLEPEKRFPVGEAHAIFVELCRGLQYLHSKRIAHKDIKPGNLLVSIEFTIKICDFGVAEQIDTYQSDGKCTKVNGTPKFQPPECVYGNHDSFDGYKADTWAAGITLYNLVSGEYPYDGTVLLKLYEAIGTVPVELPKNVKLSSDLRDLLKKLLEKEYPKRLTVEETMTHPWFLSAFPEDQGMGRIMERMRTGDRPLTMLPGFAYLYDNVGDEVEVDDDGNEMYIPPLLVQGGPVDKETFPGLKWIGKEKEECPLAQSASRPSSRSAPTAPPPTQPEFPAAHIDRGSRTSSRSRNGLNSPARGPEEGPAAPLARRASPIPPQRHRNRRRTLFSCIFRTRTNS